MTFSTGSEQKILRRDIFLGRVLIQIERKPFFYFGIYSIFPFLNGVDFAFSYGIVMRLSMYFFFKFYL